MKSPRAARKQAKGPRAPRDPEPAKPEPQPEAKWLSTTTSNRAMRRAAEKGAKA